MKNLGTKFYVCFLLTCWHIVAGQSENAYSNPLLKKRKMQGLLTNLSNPRANYADAKPSLPKKTNFKSLATQIDALDTTGQTPFAVAPQLSSKDDTPALTGQA